MQGRGLINDPYIILTAADLEDIALEPEAHYRLEADIELSGPWTPLPGFFGTLNGNGKLISGLETNTSTTRAGLFESVNNAARVTHLTLVTTASGITGHVDDYKAVLCGQVICSVAGQYPFLDRVVVFGHVNTSGNRAGGLFGGIHGGDGGNADAKVFLNECAVFCTVSGGGSLVGGVCGFVEDTSILGANACFTSTEKSGEGIIRGSSAFAGFYDLAAASISDPAAYTGWDFTNTWEMTEDGYPRLRNFPPDTATQSAKVSGIVQVDSSPAQRQVRAYGYYPVLHDIDGSSVTLSKSLGHAVSDAGTGEYTIDLLGGYGNEIFVVAFDDYGDDFTPEMAVNVGDRVHPTTPNGYVFECTGSGTLPTEEPTWITDTESSQLYGTASMIARVFYQPMVHGPIDPEITMTEWTPEELFKNSEQGGWYDPSDLTTLFQDAAGAIPVTTDGDPVGLMMDKSGNSDHALQSESANRPIYRTDGTLHWLEFNGTSHRMNRSGDGFVSGFSMIIAARYSETASQRILIGHATDDNKLGVINSTRDFFYRAIVGGSAVDEDVPDHAGIDTVFSGTRDNNDVAIGRIGGAPLASQSAQGGEATFNVLGAAHYQSGNIGYFFAGRFYGAVIRSVYDLTSIELTESYLAEKSGATLS